MSSTIAKTNEDKSKVSFSPINKIKIITAASLFDGHDVAINIMRRIIQSKGVEVVHLGHNRSVDEIVNTAIQEDAQAIALLTLSSVGVVIASS